MLSASLHFIILSNNALAAPSCNVSIFLRLINARDVHATKIICTAAARKRFLKVGLSDVPGARGPPVLRVVLRELN